MVSSYFSSVILIALVGIIYSSVAGLFWLSFGL
jgi:hypothetical protein